MGDWPAVVTSRELGRNRSRLTHALQAGELVRVYPGVYADPARRNAPQTRISAAVRAIPSGILLGRAALFVTSAWHLGPGPIQVAGRSRWRDPSIELFRSRVEPDWIRASDGLRCTAPAWSVAFLAAFDRGAAIDDFLRQGGSLSDVETAGVSLVRWPGHSERQAVIAASRDRPWSQAERLFHQILRRGGISGWVANLAVTARGSTYFLDVAFEALRLAFEIDGFTVHSTHTAFVRDRERGNALALAGWQVYHFTWASLHDEDSVIRVVRDAWRAASRRAA